MLVIILMILENQMHHSLKVSLIRRLETWRSHSYLDKKDKSEGAYGHEKQDPDIKDKKGSQPAKYFKGISKTTKTKRDSHFKSQSKKSDSISSSYKPALVMDLMRRQNHLCIQRSLNRCMVKNLEYLEKGQPANSDKHSDLYTDENPKGTIHGLGFKDVETAKSSVSKIENSGKSHAHKINNGTTCKSDGW